MTLVKNPDQPQKVEVKQIETTQVENKKLIEKRTKEATTQEIEDRNKRQKEVTKNKSEERAEASAQISQVPTDTALAGLAGEGTGEQKIIPPLPDLIASNYKAEEVQKVVDQLVTPDLVNDAIEKYGISLEVLEARTKRISGRLGENPTISGEAGPIKITKEQIKVQAVAEILEERGINDIEAKVEVAKADLKIENSQISDEDLDLKAKEQIMRELVEIMPSKVENMADDELLSKEEKTLTPEEKAKLAAERKAIAKEFREHPKEAFTLAKEAVVVIKARQEAVQAAVRMESSRPGALSEKTTEVDSNIKSATEEVINNQIEMNELKKKLDTAKELTGVDVSDEKRRELEAMQIRFDSLSNRNMQLQDNLDDLGFEKGVLEDANTHEAKSENTSSNGKEISYEDAIIDYNDKRKQTREELLRFKAQNPDFLPNLTNKLLDTISNPDKTKELLALLKSEKIKKMVRLLGIIGLILAAMVGEPAMEALGLK